MMSVLIGNEFPNFLIIGAAKSGTTALFDLLAQHPGVYRPFAKEPKFFTNDVNFARGADWYTRTYFKGAGRLTARGEATPHYLYWGKKAAPRIQQAFGPTGVKFIAIFRDPVKRAYSQYWMDVQREIETLSFPDALSAEEQRLIDKRQELEPAGLLKYGYFRGGCYATLLEPYLRLFPREQFHFLLQEDLKKDFSAAAQGLAEFLGIQPGFDFQPVVSNPAYAPRSSRLHHFFLFPSGPLYRIARRLFRILPESRRYRLRRKAVQANLRPTAYPPMNPDVERQLRVRYREEIKQLEIILGRSLSHWRQDTA